MKTPPRPSEPEGPFEHPVFENLYSRVIRDLADRRLDERTRKAAARALAFLLREQLLDELTSSDVLAALQRSLDAAKIVRTLLLGLRDALGDHERITEWARTAVDRALREGHLASFVAAMRILVDLRDYDGTVPTRWRLAILRAVQVPKLTPQVGLFAETYRHRFPVESWHWVSEARVRSMVASLRGSR